MKDQTTDDARNASFDLLRQKLEAILNDDPRSLEAEVAQEALESYAEDPTTFFHDLANHGCVSGMVGKLTYYSDTHTFFDHYYDDIEWLREEVEADLGEPLRIHGDLKNFFAWFAFEETAYRMARDLGIGS